MPTYSSSSSSIGVTVTGTTHTTSLTIAGPTTTPEETPVTYTGVLSDTTAGGVIANAQITLSAQWTGSGGGTKATTGYTDSNGAYSISFTFANPITGSVEVRATWPGVSGSYASATSPSIYLTVTTLTIATTLTLTPPAPPIYERTMEPFIATLTTTGGLPIDGATLTLSINGVVAYTGITYTQTGSGHGQYLFPVVFPGPGTYTLVANFAGWTPT